MKKDEKMLLLSCCAPCSAGVIQTLAEGGRNFAVAFYNPNIRPIDEYEKRRDENHRICEKYGVPFIEFEYDFKAWDCATAGLQNEPERGARCSVCFTLRLRRAAEFAKKNGYTCFSSVLGISRHKDFNQVNRAAHAVAHEIGVPYDDTNWRLNGGEALRSALEKELGLYRQRYCGCHPR